MAGDPDVDEGERARPRRRRRARRRRRHDRRLDRAPRRARPASGSSPPAGSAACTAARATRWDESADLTTLSRTPVLVVCAGVKSILDVGATLERLETLNVGVLGYRTDRFPGFYLRDSGHGAVLDGRPTPAEVAAGAARAGRAAAPPATAWCSPTRSTPGDELDRDAARPHAGRRAGRGRRAPACTARTSRRSCSTSSTARRTGASLAANVALVLSQRAAGGARSRRRTRPRHDPRRLRRRPDGRRRWRSCPARSRPARTRRPRSPSTAAARRPTSPPGWSRPARAATFVGRVGDDALGRRAVDELAAAGVDTRGERRPATARPGPASCSSTRTASGR